MIKVGVTGGIGSGKTAFCREMERLGAYVVYADDFAKKLMQEDPELRKKITDAFGSEAYHSDGTLNRAYLATEAFEKGRAEELNDLVHPLLWKRVNEISSQKAEKGLKVFIVEAAILLNNGRPDFVDYVILLQSLRQTRIERVIQRDNSKENEIIDRMKKQPDFDQISYLSDIEIRNDGTLEDLKNKAAKIYKELEKEAQKTGIIFGNK